VESSGGRGRRVGQGLVESIVMRDDPRDLHHQQLWAAALRQVLRACGGFAAAGVD